MNKRTILTALIGLNLFLAAALVLTAYPPSAAHAQLAGGAGNYVMIAGEAQNGTDVLYLFDLPNRNVHVIAPTRVGNSVKLKWRATRNLQRDLRP